MLRNGTMIAAAGLLAGALLQPATASAATVPTIVAGGTISVQYIPNEQARCRMRWTTPTTCPG